MNFNLLECTLRDGGYQVNWDFDDDFVKHTNRLNKTTSVVEVHFALSKKLDSRQVVFPVGDNYVSKGIFFIGVPDKNTNLAFIAFINNSFNLIALTPPSPVIPLIIL